MSLFSSRSSSRSNAEDNKAQADGEAVVATGRSTITMTDGEAWGLAANSLEAMQELVRGNQVFAQ
ncbi:MAG: hypothetical protein AAGI11_07205, partial [Pseudomonadota bacterium]